VRTHCASGQLRALRSAHAHGAAFLDYVEAELAQARCAVEDADLAALPFDFWGGWVGYFGCVPCSQQLRPLCPPPSPPG